MNRKLLVTLLLVSVLLATPLASVNASPSSPQQRPRRLRRPPSPRPSRVPATAAGVNHDARFNAFAAEYLRGFYAFNPSRATALGLHEYDSALEARSRDDVAREIKRLRAALAELARLPEWRLSTEARYDHLVLASHARAQLLELEEIRMWRRDANVYNRLVASSIDNILKRNYAPVEQRLDAVLARERQIARLLGEARANLLTNNFNGDGDDSSPATNTRASGARANSVPPPPPPRIYTETAIAQARGSVEYFTRVVPQMIERAGGGRLSAARRAEFDAANENVIASLRSFVAWMESELLPRSTGSFALGEENFRRKLLYEEMVETPPAQLIRDGERELRRTQDEMRALAEEVAPGRGVAAALEVLGREHPTADGLVGETRVELDRIRAFVRTQGLMSVPARESLTVAETPEFARSTSFASMDAPGAFERAAPEAFYYVTPPDPAWDARRREEHLSFYNRYALPLISIHEVAPGHYYQLLAAKNSPSRVRSVLASASFVEGWAHYCEQMMLDEGFGGNNPKFKLAQLQLALLRLCRYLVALRMHTGAMSYDEGVEFFVREGYQARTNAEREARRGTIDPTYLVYTLGKMEILKLRAEWRARMGDSFRLGDFHDRLLSYGSPPVKIVRTALFGGAGTNNNANSSPTASPSSTNGARGDDADGGDAGDESVAVDFSVLATGTMSEYEGARSVELIVNQEGWERAWRLIGGGRPAPEVNFNTRAIVVVHQGQKSTGGYGVSVEKIRRVGTVLAVYVQERRPASEDVTTQVVTSPFVAVSVPRPPTGASVRLEGGATSQTGRAREAEPKPSSNRQENVTPRTKRRRVRRRKN